MDLVGRWNPRNRSFSRCRHYFSLFISLVSPSIDVAVHMACTLIGGDSGSNGSGEGCLADVSLGTTSNFPLVPCCTCFSTAFGVVQISGWLSVQLHILQDSIETATAFVAMKVEGLWSRCNFVVPEIAPFVPSISEKRLKMTVSLSPRNTTIFSSISLGNTKSNVNELELGLQVLSMSQSFDLMLDEQFHFSNPKTQKHPKTLCHEAPGSTIFNSNRLCIWGHYHQF